MNCKHCGSRWDVAPELASKMTTCPFCNQPLIEKKVYPLTTIEGVLQQIVIQQGEEVLYSGSRMTAFFADIAPKMIRERRLVRIFTDSNAHKTILSARNSEEDVRRKSYEQAVLRLQDDYYIAESAARMMCRAFYLAVYGESIEEPQKPEAVSPSPQPAAAPAKPRSAAASAEQQPVAVPVNNPEACYTYAKAYETGGTVDGRKLPADMDKAIKFYETAANMGHTKSQIRLGELYYSHLKVKRDLKASARWYTMAANQGNINAMLGLLQVCRVSGDKNQYAMWAARLAEMGNPQGMLELGRCYRDGKGLPADESKARYYLNLAAKSVGDAAVAQTAAKELKALENRQQTADGSDFVLNGTVLVKYTGSSLVVHVPQNVTEIGAFAFSNNQRVRHVVMPNTVQRIGTSAFQGCGSLKTVDLSPNVTHIENRAFADCGALSKITLPDSLQILGMYAFCNCSALYEIAIPGSIRAVNPGTFQSCKTLKYVTLNYGIQYIDRQAFGYCAELTMVRIPDSLLSVEEQAFACCHKLSQYTASPAWRAVNGEILKRIIQSGSGSNPGQSAGGETAGKSWLDEILGH